MTVTCGRAADAPYSSHAMTTAAQLTPDQAEGRILYIAPATVVTSAGSDRGRAAAAAQVVICDTIADDLAYFTTHTGRDVFVAAADAEVFDLAHRHFPRNVSRGAGRSPIRGGGRYTHTQVVCACGWSSTGNTKTAQAREAWVSHLAAIVQAYRWRAADDPKLRVHLPDQPETDARDWAHAVKLIEALPAHRRANAYVYEHDRDGSKAFVHASQLPSYLIDLDKPA